MIFSISVDGGLGFCVFGRCRWRRRARWWPRSRLAWRRRGCSACPARCSSAARCAASRCCPAPTSRPTARCCARCCASTSPSSTSPSSSEWSSVAKKCSKREILSKPPPSPEPMRVSEIKFSLWSGAEWSAQLIYIFLIIRDLRVVDPLDNPHHDKYQLSSWWDVISATFQGKP